MSDFVVSARKYRPATFSHVLGQSHITATLKNAVRDQHLAQAFLFCGPRGVGKTTCARILAKIINCEQVTPDVEPCNACASCASFNQGGAMNIYELDAASNNSVEDIRALVDQVRYPPPTGQYKVYIVDEVHMLSVAAFNAFLKTLEEPPSYAIFILATTEKHKIIPTILSRCQIFDFHRIQPLDIVQQLKAIAAQEGIAYEEEALHLIGQKADGALRDALSIFDLIVTFAAGQVLTYADTRAHLHILDHEYYFQLTDAFLRGDVATALVRYDEILRAGFDGYHFMAGLVAHFRHLMVCRDTATLPLLEASEGVREQYRNQAAQASLPFLLKALEVSNECALTYKGSYNPRLHIELTLITLAHLSHQPAPLPAAPETPKQADTLPTTQGALKQDASPSQPAPLPAAPEAPQQLDTPPTTQGTPKQNASPPQPALPSAAPEASKQADTQGALKQNASPPQPAPPPAVTEVPKQLDTPPTTQDAPKQDTSPSQPAPSPVAPEAPKQVDTSSNPEPQTPAPAVPIPSTPSAQRPLPSTLKLPQLAQLKNSLVPNTSTTAQPDATASGPEPPPPTAAVPTQPLTHEAVLSHWQDHARELKAAGKMSEYSILSQPFSVEGGSIVITLANAVQQDILAGMKESLAAKLRLCLGDTKCDIRGKVMQRAQHKKPYTAQEKFTYLAQKYPTLRTLQAKLALKVQD